MGGGSSVNPSYNAISKPDEFVKQENKEKKKGLSTKAKICIGVGVAATLGTIVFLIAKGRVSEAKQLAEHIDFAPAKTVEEAIKFGKKNLGIKNYAGFEEKDIEAINWINEGLVNTSNKFKGKLRMPKYIAYQEYEDNLLAGVVNQKGHEYDGWFLVNKKFFKDPVMNMNAMFDNAVKRKLLVRRSDGAYEINKMFSPEAGDLLVEKMNYFKNNPTLASAIEAEAVYKELLSRYNSYKKSHLHVIDCFLKNDKMKKVLSINKFQTDINEIKKLPLNEQKKLKESMSEFLEGQNILKLMQNITSKNKAVADKIIEEGLFKDLKELEELKGTIDFPKIIKIKALIEKETGKHYDTLPIHLYSDNLDKLSRFQTIYHEMGHLQDMVPRCQAAGKFKYDYSKYPKELKDWVDNQEYMQLANRVSGYASSGPGEFIAETFAKMISGNKVPDEVLELYKKLHGPAVPGYC